MSEAKVVDLTVICQSFPETPTPLIDRENFLDTIDALFERGTELIVVEGAEGIGKTTLLAQFATRHANHTFSLFVRPASRWAYDPDILRFDLCNQIQWVLRQQELTLVTDANDAFWKQGLTALQKLTRRGQRFYFVVDGLDAIPQHAHHIQDFVLDLLPFGLKGFRFLLSGDYDSLSAHTIMTVRQKPYPLSGFTLGNALEFLRDFGIDADRQALEDLWRVCRGIPGRLVSVRRLLQSGTSVQTLLDAPDMLDWFQIEWSPVDQCDCSILKHLLAILAFDPSEHQMSNLARMLQIEIDTVQELLKPLSFLEVSLSTGKVRFVSEAFRRYASVQLRDLKEQTFDLIIDSLFRDPDSPESRANLPGYLKEAGRLSDILTYLSPDHFPRMIELSQSLSPIRQQADLALSAARDLGRDDDLARFAVQCSSMTELDGARVWQSEIEARTALGDYEAAVALAQTSVLREEQLHMLAVIARAKHEQGLAAEPELLDRIRQLYDQIDISSLGESAIDIASDLLYSHPELAIEMVERATNTNVEEHALDWAFAKLSLAALHADSAQRTGSDTVESIRSRIHDPKVRTFSIATSLLIGDYSADEVIARATELESADKRLHFLRQWATVNREREDAVDVVDYALELAIETTPYSPNARVFREIASPLPFIEDRSRAKQLVGRFDSQKGTIERFGPSEDYVRLQLLLAQTESRYDLAAACNRLMEIYLYYINDLDDLAVKAGCIARLVATLAKMDHRQMLEQDAEMCSLTEHDLRSEADKLLSGTADHYHAARSIVRALARTRPELALEIVRELNTQPRRDVTRLELIESSLDCPDENVDLILIERVIQGIEDPDVRDDAVLKTVGRLSRMSGMQGENMKMAFPILDKVQQIRDPAMRCNACCLACAFLVAQETDAHSGLTSHLLQVLSTAWETIDVGWVRVDTGFKIAKSLARVSVETARWYLAQTDSIRDEMLLDANQTASAYLACFHLALRAFGGLLPANHDSAEDIERLERLIDRVPSYGERAALWGDLALQYHSAGRLSDCKQLVAQHVRACLANVQSDDAEFRSRVVISVAPALFCAHEATALEQISVLPAAERDSAYSQICDYILTKHLPTDPHDTSTGRGYDVSYEDVVDICRVIKLMDLDSLIYHYVRCIADSVGARQVQARFNRQQLADIADRLEEVIESTLPRNRHIKHQGYKIAALAQIGRIRRLKTEDWLKLINAALALPNLADRALVLCMTATAMPKREYTRSREIVKEALQIVGQIPATLDRIVRYEEIASMVAEVDSSLSKECLRMALQFAVETDRPELYPVQRRIIDLAYRLDERFAASLASMADDDPVKARTRDNLSRRLKTQELRRRLADGQVSSQHVTSVEREILPQSAWILLGSLHANRIATVPVNQTREAVQIAAYLPISQSYPILAWVVENANKRHAKTDQVTTHIRPLFEAMLLGTELAGRMAARSSTRARQAMLYASKLSAGDSTLIKAGQRENALAFITKWFEDDVRSYIKICDPFFGPEDIDVLQMLYCVKPDCNVKILTSRKHHSQSQVTPPYEDAYRTHWRLKVSDQDPPDTEIVIVGTSGTGESPIHDRWWLTQGGGLRLGTSYNSLGLGRDSEISFLTAEEAEAREAEVDRYLQRVEKEHKGEKLLYSLFTL